MPVGPEIQAYLRNYAAYITRPVHDDDETAVREAGGRLIAEHFYVTSREAQRRVDKALALRSKQDDGVEDDINLEERERTAVDAEINEMMKSLDLRQEAAARDDREWWEKPPLPGPVSYAIRGTRPTSTPLAQENTGIARPNNSSPIDKQESTRPTVYQPLDTAGHAVRILLLKPGTQGDIRIHCELEHANLDEEPLYEALSYVWDREASQLPGESPMPLTPKAIFLNNKRVIISANLFDALQHLRLSDRVRRLWVDALCIDQSNVPERNHQVAQMAKIYSTAWRTIAWLGPQGYYGDDAMQLIKSLPLYSNKDGLYRLKELCADAELQNHWFMLGALFKNTYWTRVWITQEVILSNDILFVCGTTSCTKEQFFRLRQCLRMTRFEHGDGANPGPQYAFPAFEDHIAPLLTLYEQRREGLELSVVDVLFHNRHRNATDNRDKLYAIQGLLKSPAVATDYGLSAKELYNDLLMRLVELDGNLDVLSFVRNTGNMAHYQTRNIEALLYHAQLNGKKGLTMYEDDGAIVADHPYTSHHINDVLELGDDDRPSWAICWHRPIKFGESEIYLPRRHNSYFRATGDSKPTLRRDGDILRLRGQVLSEVVTDGSCSDVGVNHEADAARQRGHGDKYGNWELLWMAWQHRLASGNVPNVYGSSMAQLKAFQSTMILGSDWDGRKDVTSGGPIHNQLYDWTELPGTECTLTRDDPGYQQKRKIMADLTEMMSRRSILTSSKFFITNTGHIGIGPRGMMRTDVVCLFEGARVPFVLRPFPDELKMERVDERTGVRHQRTLTTERLPGNEQLYYLVGNCYLHGAMEGEMYTERRSELISLL